MEEEIVILEEQLAAAEANIEQLQSRLSVAESLVADRERDLAEARRRLDQAQGRIAEKEDLAGSLSAEAAALRQKLEDALEQARGATLRYREALLAREPELPADLVQGDTVADVDAAVERARQTVARVRQHLEQQAQAQRVPAGVPPRAGFDATPLTPAEKIRLGLERA